MKEQSQIAGFFNDLAIKLRSLDGTVVGQKMDVSKMRLAKDDRGAWVNHLTDQYMKKEPLDEPPEEFEITVKDILKEISQREIMKVFGK